jgi:hypothetical protein
MGLVQPEKQSQTNPISRPDLPLKGQRKGANLSELLLCPAVLRVILLWPYERDLPKHRTARRFEK